MNKIKLMEKFNKIDKNKDNLSFCYNLVFKNPNQSFIKIKEEVDFFINYCNLNDMQKSKAWTYSFLGGFYKINGYINKSIEYYNKSLNVFEKIDYSKGIINISNILATIFYEMGVYSNSSRICKKAYKYVKLIKDREVIINLFYTLTKDSIRLEQFFDARDIIEYASINYELLYSVNNRILTYCIRSEIEYYSRNYDISLNYVEEATKLMESFKLFKYKSYIYKLLANINYKIGNKKDIDEYYNISIDCAKNNNLTYEVVEISFNYGLYKLNVSLVEEGINILKEALKKSIDYNYFSLTCDICKELYKIYKDRKDFKLSLYYYEVYHYSYQKIQDHINLNYINISSDKSLLIGTIYNNYKNKTETLSNLGQSIISKLNIQEMLKTTYESINKLAKVDYSSIALYDDKNGKIVIRSYNDGIYKKVSRSLSSHKKELMYKQFRDNKVININNNHHDYYKLHKYIYMFEIKDKINSSLFYPLLVNNNIIGIMSFHKFSGKRYSIEDENILKVIVDYISISVLNSMKYNIMKKNAIYDSLTRTFSRFEIIKIGKDLISKLNINNNRFSILITDINRFKDINDKYGHIVGDQILIMVTNIIKKISGNDNYIGRYEGNKFLIIFPKLSDKKVNIFANKVKMAIENTEFLVGLSLYINISMRYGIYEFEKDDVSFKEGIDIAIKDLNKYHSS